MRIDARFHIVMNDFVLAAEFSVPAAGVIAVFGPSGCGKTTLLRAIAGLEQHHDGYLKVGDTIWQENGFFAPPHQRSLGYVFQESRLFGHLSVWRNLQYAIKRVPEAERYVSLDWAIELLDIGSLLQRRPETLSGGERQRVAIARALAVSPRLLLMDEPLAALDEGRKQEILSYIESLNDELDIPVIYVSHSADEVARLADHLILLETGGVVATGHIQEMLTCLDLPLAHDDSAEALIEVTVVAHDNSYDLTYVEFSGGRFSVPRRDLPLGCAVRLRVAARDVSLTLQRQADTSILNIFSATVDSIADEQSAQITVRLLVGGVPMLARVTRKSAVLLDLRPGKEVYAQIKSVALLS